MYTIDQINSIRHRARALKLGTPWEFHALAAAALTKICNGYGPDKWSDAGRKVLTVIYRKYPCSAAIHDVRYHYSDGTQAGRQIADDEFGANLELEWAAVYGWSRWINPVALYARVKIRAAYVFVKSMGADAWAAAFGARPEA